MEVLIVHTLFDLLAALSSLAVTAAVPVGEAQKPVYDSAPGVHDSVPVTHRHQFVALAVSRRDGSVSWKKVLREEWPHEGGHVTGSLASNSPVTDGEDPRAGRWRGRTKTECGLHLA